MNTPRSERLPILGELRGEIMVFESLTLRDLAPQGASIETHFPLQLDSLHDIRLTLGSTAIVVKGRVVHSRISEIGQDVVRYQTGLEFVELPSHAAEAIHAFIADVTSGRGRIGPGERSDT